MNKQLDKENNDLATKAMEIILHAGDARLEVNHALNAIAGNDFNLSEKKLELANDKLVKAHAIHTVILQQIASEEMKEQYSILFTHAQDTLMTIYSEYNLAKQLVKITRNIQDQISKLK